MHVIKKMKWEKKMQLKISNVAKIKEAVINIDGITVIAGENNTGKSTIGKLLFAIFNSMNNMSGKIEQEKRNEIYQILNLLIQNYIMQKGITQTESRSRNMYISKKLTEKLTDKIMEILQNENDGHTEEYVSNAVIDSELFKDTEDTEDFINECILKLKTIVNISDKKVMTEVITRWFNRVFENQISPLIEDDIKSKINLTIKNKELEFIFQDNSCIDWNSEINILHQAFYIDNPFIVDYMSDRYIRNNVKTTDTHLLKHLCKQEDIFDGIFDTVVVKDKLNEIYNMLGQLIEGEIIGNQDGEYYLKSSQYTKPLNIKNLSTGLKSFALIKRLLENGSLKEKDILILDEPEIHLHPEWQLAYAELIVLLQKEFDLTMIITTHSPYFLDAIDVFSAKYEMSNRVNYYLAENEGVTSYMRNVTNNIDAIYKKLSDPMQKLENIRNELM